MTASFDDAVRALAAVTHDGPADDLAGTVVQADIIGYNRYQADADDESGDWASVYIALSTAPGRGSYDVWHRLYTSVPRLWADLTAALTLAAIPAQVEAARLADAQVRSYDGKPREADSEMTT